MIECAMPQDILKYKAKFIGNFTAREVIWLGIGGTATLTSYFTFLSGLEMLPRIYASAFLAVPFFLFGFYKPFGQPLEKVLIQVIFDNFICPPIRKYEIRHPEFEKYQKDSSLKILDEAMEADDNANKKKKSKKKNKKNEKKIIKSKEYKAIH